MCFGGGGLWQWGGGEKKADRKRKSADTSSSGHVGDLAE